MIFKLDCVSGRLGMKLLAWLRLLGFVLYPRVPSTTAASQKTNRNYGPFKTVFWSAGGIEEERVDSGFG